MIAQRDDERCAAVAWTGGTFACVVVVALAAAAWIGRYERRPPLAVSAVERRVDAFPRPRLQRAPDAELDALQRERDALVHDWAWVDRERGICRVPADEAMEILLATHFELSR